MSIKVLILGASGIVGQHMRLCIPEGVHPTWVRRHADPITRGVDLTDIAALNVMLRQPPDVIVNLAGESSVDKVERDPAAYRPINVILPRRLAIWAQLHGKRLIQISSQAVFSGDDGPYSPNSDTHPINVYGRQKELAEESCLVCGATVMRLSFILGLRPLPHVGRRNPLEAMLSEPGPQVNNRWFSPLMAMDAAKAIWAEVLKPSYEPILHVGIPEAHTRFSVALATLGDPGRPAGHEDFEGLAPRPKDTTYKDTTYKATTCAGAGTGPALSTRILAARAEAACDRATEISLFTGMPLERVKAKLASGFGQLHAEVTEDFNRAGAHKTEAQLLDWYRTTEAYIWELSAYHEDIGFNYAGMCSGICERLKAEGAKRVLCLGDGIGDLTLACVHAGLTPVYHDLRGSRTAYYASFRRWRHGALCLALHLSLDFRPPCFPGPYDAVCSLDFLEHVPNVREWVWAVYACLKPGGLFCAQNAFAIGSGEQGSMPMHLALNDKWEREWDPLLTEIGFEQLSSNWYRKIAK